MDISKIHCMTLIKVKEAPVNPEKKGLLQLTLLELWLQCVFKQICLLVTLHRHNGRETDYDKKKNQM